jgi:hypothetical protein
MTTDPAWFYSTLAQSSAAILGSRMLTHLQQLVESRKLLFAAVREIQRDFAERRREIQGFRTPWNTARQQVAVAMGPIVPAVAWPQNWIGNPAGMNLASVNRAEFFQVAEETLRC